MYLMPVSMRYAIIYGFYNALSTGKLDSFSQYEHVRAQVQGLS